MKKKKRSQGKQPTNKSSKPRGQRSKTISHVKMIVAKHLFIKNAEQHKRIPTKPKPGCHVYNFTR